MPYLATLFDDARRDMARAVAAAGAGCQLVRLPSFVKAPRDCMAYSAVAVGKTYAGTGWSCTAHVHLQQRLVQVVCERDDCPGVGWVITSRDPAVRVLDLESGDVVPAPILELEPIPMPTPIPLDVAEDAA